MGHLRRSDPSRNPASRFRGGGRGKGKPLPEGEERGLEGRGWELNHSRPKGLVGFCPELMDSTQDPKAPTQKEPTSIPLAFCLPLPSNTIYISPALSPPVLSSLLDRSLFPESSLPNQVSCASGRGPRLTEGGTRNDAPLIPSLFPPSLPPPGSLLGLAGLGGLGWAGPVAV